MTAAAVETSPELAWLDALEVAAQASFDPALMSPSVLRDAVRRAARLVARLQSRQVALVRELEARNVAKDCGSSSTGALVAGDFGGNRGAGDRLVRTAQNLESATLTQRALEAGEISLEQAEIIARTVAGLTDSVDEITCTRVEKALLSDAKIFSVRDLRRRVLRVADLYADAADANADENSRLAAQEARAWQSTELWMSPARDGLVRGGFTIPETQADLLKNCLDAVAAPRRLEFAADDELTSSQRLGRALCTWIEHLPTDRFPTTGGTPAAVTIAIDLKTLTDDLEAAGTVSTGARISAGEVRRLACSHGILPKVLDGASLPLDLGRAKRLFSRAQRLALAERDRGCSYPGCDRPPAWCESHHVTPWARGGRTDVNSGVLLCAFHHHRVHRDTVPVRLHNNRAEFRIEGIWQRNHRWRT